MAEIKIQDRSGDKDFFTIIPNYITNHSTANDQALYLQMKRYAGEEGKCFATEKTLMAKLAVGKKAFDKSLQYLLEKKWISYVGMTQGKTRPIKTYKIENIWELNTEHYLEISSESNISLVKDKSQKEGDKFQKQHKISAESNVEEEQYKEELEEEHVCNASVAKQIQEIITLFKKVNPTYERLFKNKTERAAIENLIKKFGMDSIRAIVEALPAIINKKYAPRITTPYQLEKRLGELVAFYKQENYKNKFSPII